LPFDALPMPFATASGLPAMVTLPVSAVSWILPPGPKPPWSGVDKPVAPSPVARSSRLPPNAMVPLSAVTRAVPPVPLPTAPSSSITPRPEASTRASPVTVTLEPGSAKTDASPPRPSGSGLAAAMMARLPATLVEAAGRTQ
jgi:hypothetical protein